MSSAISFSKNGTAIVNTLNRPTSSLSKPRPAIGFTAIYTGTPHGLAKSQQVMQRALAHFNNLSCRTLKIGETTLTLWGRGNLENCCYTLPDGSTLVLIGSPSGSYTWDSVAEQVLNTSIAEPFILPWEGRVNLLRIDPQSNVWTLWNDWVGSIPIFHGQRNQIRIASTLEPVVVETLALGEQDIFLPGLLALLMWGHYFSDWTLFTNMKVVPPDCEARWEQNAFRSFPRHSVEPSDQRWDAGWDEILEEMYVLSKNAITSVLKEHSKWILPLSSGLDSRLIAAVAAELNIDVRAYTWGRPKTSDVIHSKRVARVLGIPWAYLNPGDTYLTTYRELWANLFGSAMHFHGMYQMPFLDSLRQEPPGPILSGFIGETLAGDWVKICSEVRGGPTPFQHVSNDYLHWKVQELHDLLNLPIHDALKELAAQYEQLMNTISGAAYQRLSLMNIWGRQRHFIYFQSMLSDYWRGVATPYISRDYARFFYSLPRALLDNRVLLKMMYVRYYPKLACIPGTYAREPALLSGRYLIKKRVANYFPEAISRFSFPDLYRTHPNPDVQSATKSGKRSFYPIFEKLEVLSNWMNTNMIEKSYRKLVDENDSNAVRKLQSIQTLAYRLSI